MENQGNIKENQSPSINYFGERVIPEPFEIERRDIIFSVLALISSILMSIFGIFGGFAVGFSISAVLMLVVLAVYFFCGRRLKAFPIICGLLAAGNCVCFFMTSNSSVKFFSFLEILILSLVFLHGLTANKEAASDVGFFAGILKSSFGSISNITISVKSLFTSSDGDKKGFVKALVGIACAIPVLIIIVPLLISSDTAFEGFFTYILASTFKTLLKAIFGVGLCLFVISYGFTLRKQRVGELKQNNFNGIDNIYIISFLSVISVLYLLYLYSQLAYFFSAFSGFLPEGYDFTASEYARRGFFEMAAIAAINLFIIYLSLGLSTKKDGKTGMPIKIMSTFIALFTMLIIATALSKMVLYIESFGMTVLRITTSAFMMFLGVVFISVLLKVYIPKVKVLKTALVAAGCVLMILGTVNVNAFAAKFNYDRYVDGSLPNIDIEALYELGDEGVPYITQLAKDENDDVALIAKDYLYQFYRYEYFDNIDSDKIFTAEDLKANEKRKGISGFTIPEQKAYDALYDYLEEYPYFYLYDPNVAHGYIYN